MVINTIAGPYIHTTLCCSSALQCLGSVYRGHQHLLDPRCSGSAERSAVWLHPVSLQLSVSTHCLRLPAGCFCQTGQWNSKKGYSINLFQVILFRHKHIVGFFSHEPAGSFLGPDWWSGDGSVSDVAWILVWYRQLYFPLSMPFPGVWHPLLTLCHHPVYLHISAGASGQLLHRAHWG